MDIVAQNKNNCNYITKISENYFKKSIKYTKTLRDTCCRLGLRALGADMTAPRPSAGNRAKKQRQESSCRCLINFYSASVEASAATELPFISSSRAALAFLNSVSSSKIVFCRLPV